MEAGPNLVHFVRRLRSLRPGIIIGQPTYGYPQVQAEVDVINASWQVGGASNNLVDTIGLMVYEGAESLRYVENYAHGSQQWEGFPVQVDVPYQAILLGCKGSSSGETVLKLAEEAVKQDLQGIMVWYASVANGFQYEVSWDASEDKESQRAYVEAMELFDHANYGI